MYKNPPLSLPVSDWSVSQTSYAVAGLIPPPRTSIRRVRPSSHHRDIDLVASFIGASSGQIEQCVQTDGGGDGSDQRTEESITCAESIASLPGWPSLAIGLVQFR